MAGAISDYSYLPASQREIAQDISEITGNVQLAVLPVRCVKTSLRGSAKLVITEFGEMVLKYLNMLVIMASILIRH